MGTLGIMTLYPATTIAYSEQDHVLTFRFDRQFTLGNPVMCVVLDDGFGEQEFNDSRVSADGRSLEFLGVDLDAGLFLALLPGAQEGFNPMSYWKNATSYARIDNT